LSQRLSHACLSLKSIARQYFETADGSLKQL